MNTPTETVEQEIQRKGLTAPPAGFNPQSGAQAEFMAAPLDVTVTTETELGDPQPNADEPVVTPNLEQPDSITVETHEQAAAINASRTAEDGYVNVGDPVGEPS